MGEQHAGAAVCCHAGCSVLERLVSVAQQIRARLAESCDAAGVNASRFVLLQAIATASDEGCSQTELASELGLSESNVCALVERLRGCGLLYRFRSKTDRRKSVLMLTERGRQLVASIAGAQQIAAGQLISVLTAAEQSELCGLLDRLQEGLDSMSQVLVRECDAPDLQGWGPSSWELSSAASSAEPTSRRAS